jgi:uncharacterized membrane protein
MIKICYTDVDNNNELSPECSTTHFQSLMETHECEILSNSEFLLPLQPSPPIRSPPLPPPPSPPQSPPASTAVTTTAVTTTAVTTTAVTTTAVTTTAAAVAATKTEYYQLKKGNNDCDFNFDNNNEMNQIKNNMNNNNWKENYKKAKRVIEGKELKSKCNRQEIFCLLCKSEECVNFRIMSSKKLSDYCSKRCQTRNANLKRKTKTPTKLNEKRWKARRDLNEWILSGEYNIDELEGKRNEYIKLMNE